MLPITDVDIDAVDPALDFLKPSLLNSYLNSRLSSETFSGSKSSILICPASASSCCALTAKDCRCIFIHNNFRSFYLSLHQELSLPGSALIKLPLLFHATGLPTLSNQIIPPLRILAFLYKVTRGSSVATFQTAPEAV